MTRSSCAARHVEHEADARRHALVEPDVRDRHGQLDVAHALAAHAARVTSTPQRSQIDALVLDALVLSAGALPVAGRTEDALAEEAALFRLERAVVDRLGILDFALAPATGSVSGEATVMATWSNPTGRCSQPKNSRADD